MSTANVQSRVWLLPASLLPTSTEKQNVALPEHNAKLQIPRKAFFSLVLL